MVIVDRVLEMVLVFLSEYIKETDGAERHRERVSGRQGGGSSVVSGAVA